MCVIIALIYYIASYLQDLSLSEDDTQQASKSSCLDTPAANVIDKTIKS